jgi:hypothetical protein
LFFSCPAYTQSIIENWDTTAAIPDETRGWDRNAGPAIISSGLGTGNYATTGTIVFLPELAIPSNQAVNEGFSNQFVGNKNYEEMGVTKISYLARFDFSDSLVQSVPTSVLLLSGEIVPDPLFPGQFVLPRIWRTSDNEMVRDAGWEEFEFPIDFTLNHLPEGWQAYPDTPETWDTVKRDVDQIIVIFNVYFYDIISLPNRWDVSLDNFEVQLGPDPIAVPTAHSRALIVLAFLIGTIGVLRSFRTS